MREIRVQVGGSLATSIQAKLNDLAEKDGVKLKFEEIESGQQFVKIHDKDTVMPPAKVHEWLKTKSECESNQDSNTGIRVWVYTWDGTYL